MVGEDPQDYGVLALLFDGAEGDGGHEAAGGSTFFSIAEKLRSVASGAEIADGDMTWVEAGFEELGVIGLAEVEQDVWRRRLMAGRHLVEPLDGIGLIAGTKFVKIILRVGKFGGEGGSDFGADFVATAADGGAKSGENVLRLGSKLHLHAANGFLDDARECAAPTGVNGGDGALFCVHEKDGDAVGSLYAEEQAGMICDGGVAAAGLRRRGFVEKADDIGMELFDGGEWEFARAESGLEAAAIFDDVFASVPIGEAEVEDFFAVYKADTTRTGAEAVEEPGKFIECGGLENADAIRGARDPFAGGDGPNGRGRAGAFVAGAIVTR
jgi:hypothetical protein